MQIHTGGLAPAPYTMTGPDWKPAASLKAMHARAEMLNRVRQFFRQRRVLEVETPCLAGAAATDPNIESFAVAGRSGEQLFLNTSPEFFMKRLLCAGSGDIYQVCKAFREDERGRLHNPEFTMLEWYRTGFGLSELMHEVAELLELVLARRGLARTAHFISYRALFQDGIGIDPLQAHARQLRQVLCELGVTPPDGEDELDALLDLAMSSILMPGLPPDTLTFVFDYPASQAALARRHPDEPGLARRFEALLNGVELANGFEELRDADEQAGRFDKDLGRRRQRGQTAVRPDDRFLAALRAGLPECCGVAMGLDRVLMLALGARSLDQVMSFPIELA